MIDEMVDEWILLKFTRIPYIKPFFSQFEDGFVSVVMIKSDEVFKFKQLNGSASLQEAISEINFT